MKKLTLIQDQQSFQDVYDILEKVIEYMKSEFYLSIIKKDKLIKYNFSFYKTDKTSLVYEQLKETNKETLREIDCYEI